MAVHNITQETKQEMKELSSAEYGVTAFTCLSGRDRMMNEPEMIEALDTVAEIGGVAFVHAENGDIIEDCEKRMLEAGITGPEGHAMAHLEEAEVRLL